MKTDEEVAISSVGKKAAALMSELPPLTLDPAVFMKRAERALNNLMQELGIPPGTKVDITVSSNGMLKVEGDNEEITNIQAALDDHEPGSAAFEVRNNLVGASVSTQIQRISAAVSKAAQAAEANPARADAFFAWASSIIDDARHMSFKATFEGGRVVSANLVTTEGKSIGITEGLTLPS